MKTKPIYVSILFLTLVTISCSYFKKKYFDFGSIESNIYSNTFFELKLQTPLNWHIQTNTQLTKLNILQSNTLNNKDNVENIINPSDVDLAYLLTIFKSDVLDTNDYNPCFILIAEKLDTIAENNNCLHYLSSIKEDLKTSQIQYNSFDEDIKKEIINSKEFYVMNCSINYIGMNLTQRYYCTYQNGFFLNAIISFIDEAQKNELEDIINSMSFNN
jgi:hypothetical protein